MLSRRICDKRSPQTRNNDLHKKTHQMKNRFIRYHVFFLFVFLDTLKRKSSLRDLHGNNLLRVEFI